MGNMSNEKKERVDFLTRELNDKQPLSVAVLRCMGASLLAGSLWHEATQFERERAFSDELEKTLDALDYVIRRVWPAP